MPEIIYPSNVTDRHTYRWNDLDYFTVWKEDAIVLTIDFAPLCFAGHNAVATHGGALKDWEPPFGIAGKYTSRGWDGNL
ncbi:MAG: hypothetical protein AMXMBFR47_02550 [Planctomycetota bacterium]